MAGDDKRDVAAACRLVAAEDDLALADHGGSGGAAADVHYGRRV